jgi:chromosome segregation ATPase
MGWVAALVVLVAAALLFVGYRVFDIEAQRRAVNEKLRLLEGKEHSLAEAIEAEIKLSQLRLQVGGAEEGLARLRDQSATLTGDLEVLRGQLESGRERLAEAQSQRQAETDRRQELENEARTLQSRIDQLKQSEEQADLAADSASRTVNGLRTEIGDLEGTRESLRTEVTEMQAQLQLRDEFAAVFATLTAGSEQIANSAKKLDAAVRAIASETEQELASVSRGLADGTERLRRSSLDLTSVARALRDAERPMNQSQARFDQTVGGLEDAVGSVSTELGRVEKQLVKATQTVTEVADRLPAADTRLASELNRLLEGFEAFKTQADRSLASMQATSLKIDKAADDYASGLEGAEGRILSSTQRLERAVSDLERARPTASGSNAPSEPREDSGDVRP